MIKEEQLERLTKLVQAGSYWRVYIYQGIWREESSYEHLKLGEIELCFLTEKDALTYLMGEGINKRTWSKEAFISIEKRAEYLSVAISKNFVLAKQRHLSIILEERLTHINQQIAKLELSKQDLLKQKEQI